MMKNTIKKLIPKWLLQHYRKFTYRRKESAFSGKSPKEVFTQIYQSNHWQGTTSVSGLGAEEAQTETIIDSVTALIEELEIKTLLDVPCGDFNWMKYVDLANVQYLGGDIVKELIDRNTKKYSDQKVHFEVMDLITNQLPESDLVINRDCLVHLSYQDIYRALANIKASGSTYLLTTTFTKHRPNYDIHTGDWRTLNLQIKPFLFPAPIRLINEHCTEDNGAFMDKSLALYLIEDIQLPLTI